MKEYLDNVYLDYIDIGKAKTAVVARNAVMGNAPDGYGFNYENNYWVDTLTGQPIYVSDDGETFKIGSETVSVADYEDTGRERLSQVKHMKALDYWSVAEQELGGA